MCLQNLPIEFDSQGRARLREGVDNPYTYQPREIDRSRIEELLRTNGQIRDLNIDPVTRVAGALAFHAVVDLQARKVHEANSIASLFRGYEVILKGRDPRDAMFISSRVCGVCGGVHSLAIEMAFGIAPPPMGLALRNIQLRWTSCWTTRFTSTSSRDPTSRRSSSSGPIPRCGSGRRRQRPVTRTCTGTERSRTSCAP